MTTEQQGIERKERINCVVDNSTGKEVYVCSTVNYGGPWQADTLEEITKKGKAFTKMWLEHGMEILEQEEPFEVVVMTPEEWEAKDDNITYWELERMKRIIKRPEVQEVWKNIIADILVQTHVCTAGEVAQKILDKFINTEIEQCMAKEDIKEYTAAVEKYQNISRGLGDILPILRDNKALMEYLGVKWYLIEDGYMHELDRVMQPQIAKLKEQMDCAHIEIKEECIGHDSHTDHWVRKCTKCGKELERWYH